MPASFGELGNNLLEIREKKEETGRGSSHICLTYTKRGGKITGKEGWREKNQENREDLSF